MAKATKTTVNLEVTAVEALTKLLANPTPLKLHGTAKSPGIFMGSSQKMKDASALCLERGWLEGTGEFAGTGKSAKETYRITQRGIDFALQNGEVPLVLQNLLAVNDMQQETLGRLRLELANASSVLVSQNELLDKLKSKVTAPRVVTGPASSSDSDSDDSWLLRIVEHVTQYRQRHPHRSCPFSELYELIARPAGRSIGEFHDGLRQLAREGKISLRPWTGAMSDLDQDHLAVVLAKEIKFYADSIH